MLQGLQLGDEAPPFSLTDHDGRGVAFPDSGRVPSVLVFGEADCPPCNTLAGELNKLANDTVRILFVSGDDADDNRRFATEHRAAYPVLSDASSSTSKAYKVRSTPFVYVVDEDGIIRSKGIANSAATVADLVRDGLGKSWTLDPAS